MDKHKHTKAKTGDIVLTLRAAGQTDTKLDPFAVGDTVTNAIGFIAKATVDANGHYTIRTKSDEQAKKLTRLKKLNNGQRIKVERHAILNTAKCVIKNPLITDIPDETLELKLKEQGVVKVRSIKPDNKLKIVHLAGTKVPPIIRIGLINVKTQKYYDMPKVCRNCKRIGHITDTCESDRHCENCSGAHTEKGLCKKPPHCSNCGGDHQPLDKTCPAYVQERAIIKLKVNQDISMRQARSKYKTKAKKKYIPLPAERTQEEMTSEESDNEAEVDVVDLTENNANEGTSELEDKGAEETGQGESLPPPKPRTKRRSDSEPGKPKKGRAKKKALATSDEDDFLPSPERTPTERQLTEEDDE